MSPTATRTFGVLLNADAEPGTMVERCQWLEALGFDQLYLPDHLSDYRDSTAPWFDGWILLAAAASATERIRIGMLVANPILRPPAVMAKQAVTIDHLSHGRLDLGIGTGILDLDHHAVGSEYWSVKERVQRFGEYVEILDGILRGDGAPYRFDGALLAVRDVPTNPPSIQRPRPPIIVGGHARTVLRTAAKFADVWNSNGRWGGGVAFDAPFDDVLTVVAERNRLLDELCAEIGRDPATLRRSLLVDPLSPADVGSFRPGEVVERASEAGIDDFVFGWPTDEQKAAFERLAVDTLPPLRVA